MCVGEIGIGQIFLKSCGTTDTVIPNLLYIDGSFSIIYICAPPRHVSKVAAVGLKVY